MNYTSLRYGPLGWSLWILMALGVSLMACASRQEAQTLSGFYKSQDRLLQAHESYDKAMELWDCPWEDEWVETSYGRTHIIASGPKEARPLFLLPGLFADATMWYANAPALSQRYRVYTLDSQLYGGKGAPGKKNIQKAQDIVNWFTEILTHYGLSQADIAGISYGSWMGLAIAAASPQSISSMILIDPSESFIPMDGGIAWKGFWSFVFFPNRDKYRRFFDWLGGGYGDPRMDIWFEHMLNVVEYGSTRMQDVPAGLFKAEAFRPIKMPVLVIAGGKPILYKNPQALASRVKELLPQARVELIPDTGHGVNMEKPLEVNRMLLDFLEED